MKKWIVCVLCYTFSRVCIFFLRQPIFKRWQLVFFSRRSLHVLCALHVYECRYTRHPTENIIVELLCAIRSTYRKPDGIFSIWNCIAWTLIKNIKSTGEKERERESGNSHRWRIPSGTKNLSRALIQSSTKKKKKRRERERRDEEGKRT